MQFTSWDQVGPQEGKQTLACSLIGKVDFMIWGGARFGGKTLLLDQVPCFFIDDSKYRGIFFRRQYDQLMGGGSLWDYSESIYPLFGGEPFISKKMWQFPSGARQLFSHMQLEGDKESHRGKSYSFIGFDEIDQFSKTQVTFLLTTLRSQAEMDSFCIGTVNPNPDSWVLPLIEYYIDEEGLPIEERCGDIRWYIVKEGEFIFGPSEEYFQENYPECLWVLNPTSKEKVYVRPKRFTYVFFNIFDNPIGIKENPAYLSELNNLEDHERDSQLYGNWRSRPKNTSFWHRSWVRGPKGERVKTFKDIPQGLHWYRAWDKGYSEPSETNRYPDYTAASPKMAKDSNGMYWLVGNYHPAVVDTKEQKDKDEKDQIKGRVRKLPGERDSLIIQQAKLDGEDCSVVLTKDTGGQLSDHLYTKSLLVENGILVEEDTSPKNTPDKKIKDFLPFSNACMIGLVYIVEESFNPNTLEAFYKDLEIFDGKKSTGTKKDDWADSSSMAFAKAASNRILKIVKRNQVERPTQASEFLKNNPIPQSNLEEIKWLMKKD